MNLSLKTGKNNNQLKDKIMDIVNTKTLVVTLAQLASAVLEAKKDGKVDVKDIGLLMPILPNLFSVLENYDQIPEELTDLTKEEKDEIVVALKANLVIGENEDEIEMLIQETLDAAWHIYQVVVAVQALKAEKTVEPTE